MKDWQPNSWQNKLITQQPVYPSANELNEVLQRLNSMPGLVTTLEVDLLKQHLANATKGNAFVLQGGDCAESFADCNHSIIANKIKIILQMSLILVHGLAKPIIRIGRIAGQYAKPRSADTETVGTITLPSYRGDLINSVDFTESARTPDPKRMLQGYFHAAATLNHIRALVDGGFAGLQHMDAWDLGFAKHSNYADQYHRLVDSIRDTLRFIKTIGAVDESLNRVDFFTSHEALTLHYEQALTHQIQNGRWYNVSTHFPWIGMRTANDNSAHIEYMRGIANPIGMKVSSKLQPAELKQLIEVLNPNNEPGRLSLIHRFGASHIANFLPQLIEAAQQTGITVLWIADPMHGNTLTTETGYKTRRFDDILSELTQAFQIHKHCGSHLGGIHFELTGDNVTECTGGARGLTEADLEKAYHTLVDPRLNYEQALEMAMLIVKTS